MGGLASIHCELLDALVVGDNTVFVGEVGEVLLGAPREPLTYFDRQFRSLAHGEVERAPDRP